MNIIIIGSLLLSILQSILFWDKNLGISVMMFTIPTIIFLIYILEKNKKIQDKKAILFSIPIILLSSTYFIFNNTFFKILNIFVIIILLIIMCIFLSKKKLKLPEFMYNILAIILGSLESIEEVLKFFKPRKKENEQKNNPNLRKLGKSILISAPIIIIVLLLLISADEIFANMFQGVFTFLENLVSIPNTFDLIIRIIFIAITFMIIAGFIINLIAKNTMYNQEEIEEDKQEYKSGINIENMTINTIFTILNIIYLIFSIIQFTNLFSTIGNDPNFDYANYARQGFFQLMFVSFINFIIIFIAKINKQEKTKNETKYTKYMSILTIIFTIIIIISAFYRMILYEQEYGYTYLRLFVYFILITELIITIPVIAYILGKKIDLLKTIITITSTMYLILNFINIDNIIAKNNIDRYLEDPEENEIDISYLITSTNTDAISQLTRLLNTNDPIVVESVKNYLYNEQRELEIEEMDFQELNLSKIEAKNVLSNIDLRIEEEKKYEDFR